MKGRENKIVEWTVVKVKIGELEEKVRSDNPRRMSKELTGVVKICLWEEEVLGEVSEWV